MSIQLYKFLNNTDCKNTKNILVIGVVHGDEPMGEYFINNFVKIKNRILKNNLYYIPRLNSTPYRTNKNGVDINRNFPTKNWELGEKDDYFGGVVPNSEIETKFVVDLMDKIKFDAILTIHAPYKIINYDGKGRETEILAETVSKILGYPIQKDIGYPTPGSFGTYAGVERNIPTITIECDEEAPVDELYLKFRELFYFLEKEY